MERSGAHNLTIEVTGNLHLSVTLINKAKINGIPKSRASFAFLGLRATNGSGTVGIQTGAFLTIG